MKKLLKLHDHQHTAKKLEHKHTSYRGLFLVMAIFGASLFFIQSAVTAEDYLVTAKVSAAVPTTASQITSVSNNYQTENPILNIIGSCPITVPAQIVLIENNGQVVGTDNCSITGNFSLNITLVNGQNMLIPKIVNITNDYGPVGSAIAVIYKPPSVPIDVGNNNVSNINNIPANSREQASVPAITASMPFITYNPNKELTWEIFLTGGSSPYTVNLKWGDGTEDKFLNQSAGKLVVKHKYTTSKTYNVIVEITDVLGVKTIHNFVAVTLVKQTQEAVLGAIKGDTSFSYMFSEKNLYAIYTFLVLLIAAFWFGARFEQTNVRTNGSKRSIKK